MMTTRRIDQIWLFGGLALAILLVVGGWFMMIKPQYNARDSVQADTADTLINLAKEQKKLAELKAQLKKVDEYKETLTTAQKALPYGTTTNKIPEFLKQLQTLGSTYDIEVSGYAASAPEESKDTPTVSRLPITLNIEGPIEKITPFLKHLQTKQPRAVLIESAKLSTREDIWELSLSLKAFITSTETITVKS
jgi:Tfp pilus assembly protein PilO